jgi:3-oxoacid CoA-transferase B subunit
MNVDDRVLERRIAMNVAKLYHDLDYSILMNLGIGIPSQVSNYINNEYVYLHAENGIVGVGPMATGNNIDFQLINAGRQPVTECRGCVYVDSAMSFGLIRGGHVDVTVLGAFEVDQEGNVANWIIPNGKQLGVGGAMDLIKGAKKVIIAMKHLNKNGKTKLVKKCSLPITGYKEADIVVTEKGMFYFENGRIILKEIACDTTVEDIRIHTEVDFEVAEDLKQMID